MAWTSLTAPVQGKSTRWSLINAIIDNLTFLYSQLSGGAGSGTQGINNPSFEQDTDTDGIPDGWVETLYPGGSIAVDDTEHSHGFRSVKFTSPGGSGNGGGQLLQEDVFEVSDKRAFLLSFQIKSSVAGVRNLVEVLWYDEAQAYISSTTIYENDTTNPTAWNLLRLPVLPPATARYAVLRLTGCENTNSTAGSTWFDDFQITDFAPQRRVEFRKAGTFQWVTPQGVYVVLTRCIGGGGGAAGGSGGSPGSGGGGGGYSEKLLAVVPGQVLNLVVGSGGVGGASAANGNAGGTTSVEATECIANGGGGGIANDSTPPGGAGATIAGAAGDIMLPGGDGFIYNGAYSGQGGAAVNGGGGAPGVNGFAAGIAGILPGEGGSGGIQPTYSGGSGAPGAVLIEW